MSRQRPREPRVRRGGEQGAGTVELVLAVPLLMLLLMGIVQFAVWSHATHIAQAAAAHGLDAARIENGTSSDGQAAAAEVLAQLAEGPLEGATIEVSRDADNVTVRLSGTAMQLVPFLTLPVHAEAAGPVERFTTAR